MLIIFVNVSQISRVIEGISGVNIYERRSVVNVSSLVGKASKIYSQHLFWPTRKTTVISLLHKQLTESHSRRSILRSVVMFKGAAACRSRSGIDGHILIQFSRDFVTEIDIHSIYILVFIILRNDIRRSFR